jgi:hypothetical protein
VFRTDNNHNPTAFTIDVAKEAGLILDDDYEVGDPFEDNGRTFYTAKLLKSPVALTTQVIDILGFYTSSNQLRWSYIAIPFELWISFTQKQKEYTIGQMYIQEGGIEMTAFFPVSPN